MTANRLPGVWPAYLESPVPTLLLDHVESIVAINPALSALLHCRPKALIGRTLAEFRLAADVSLLPAPADGLSPHENCYRRPDGEEIWVAQWQWEAGEGQTIVQMLDISERKSLELIQTKRLDLLSRYADAVPGMVAYWRADMRCAFANGAYREWFGKAPETMPGIHIRELLGERLFKLNEPYIRGALAGQLQQFERTLTKANGEIGYTWAQYIPDIEDGKVLGFFVLVSDISVLKAAQSQVEKVNAALAERTREAEAANQAKTLFLSMISHELRSPLHTILGYSELLQRRQPDQQAELQTIEASGKRLLRLINDILEFNNGEAAPLALHPAPLSLPLFADQIAKTGALLAQRHRNRLTVELDTTLPSSILMDEQRLNQAVMNLVDNACKFVANGNIHVHFSLLAKQLHITVMDDGPGIAKADQQDIFAPFIRGAAHCHHPGIGLGLAVVKQIVHGMQGKIKLHSKPGQGCRFEIRLPLQRSPDAALATAPHPEHVTGYAGPRRTLLIAEDIEENLQLLQTLCADWGFATRLARNGAQAIQTFATTPSIDAVIVDQVMAPGDGWDVLRHIRQSARPEVPVILISAQIPHPPADLPPAMNFDATLQKPVSPPALASTIAQLLGIRWKNQRPTLSTAPPSPLQRPSRQMLRPAVRMLELGQILAIEQWASELARKTPKFSEFASAVHQRCHAVDLAGLRALILDDSVTATHGR